MEKGGNTKLIIASMVSIFLIVFLLIGITFAYLQATITWNSSTPKITGSTPNNILIQYTGTDSINCSGCYPGWSGSLTFKVKNIGDGKGNYNVIWYSFTNNFSRKGDLRYTITCTSSSGTCTGVSTSKELPNTLSSGKTETIISNVSIASGVTHTYKLNVTYVNLNTTQDVDKNKTFTGRISITAASTKN